MMMKKLYIFCLVFLLAVKICAIEINWQNPLLNRHSATYVPAQTYSPQSSEFKSTSVYTPGGGIYLSTQHMDRGAYTGAAGGNGFGGSIGGGSTSQVPQISFSGGSFSTSYVAVPTSPTAYKAPGSTVTDGEVYNGDKPGIITGLENQFVDNAIITAAGGWYQTECPVCFHTVWRQKNHGAQDDMYDEPNGSKKHVCQGHPDVPIGDINLFVLLMFVCVYSAFKNFLIKKETK